jgi:hypothetical protein
MMQVGQTSPRIDVALSRPDRTSSSMSDQSAVVRKMAVECFENVNSIRSFEDRRYRIGGDNILVRYCEQKLAALLHRSLAHLECDAGERPSLTIHAISSAVPPLTLSADEWLSSAIRWKSQEVNEHEPFTLYVPGNGGRFDLMVAGEHQAVACFRDPDRIPAWDVATPFRDILHAWFRLRGGHILHGAVVADRSHAVMLAGAGGSGKSSSAMACLRHSDLHFLGDDVTLIRDDGDGRKLVHSLYNTAKLLPHDCERFAGRLSRLDDSGDSDGKPTFYTYPDFGDRLAKTRILQGFLLVRPHPAEQTVLSPASPGDTWRAIAPSTMSLLTVDAGGIKWLGSLAAALPACWLNVGSRRQDIPVVIAGALNSFVQIPDATPGGAASAKPGP